ncbi:PDZ domain-containing protein [Nonomuraea sp. B10E15]|uniref:PDZ domain-containing protein n=1 Tax=unclassified Nonomuraea TaxID=2593643 RepID=UPI00325D6F4A
MDLHPWDRRGRTIDFIRSIRASQDEIWERLSTPAGIKSWLRMSEVELELKEGGAFRFALHTQGRADVAASHEIVGRVKEAVPGWLLALEYPLPASGVWTDLSFQLRPSYPVFHQDYPVECDLWLTHSGFPHEGLGLFEFDGHHRHWRQRVLDLAVDVEGRPPLPRPSCLSGLQFVGGATGIGLLVSQAIKGSPADVAGIREGDVLVSVNGIRMNALDDFHDWIDECEPGDVGEVRLQDRTVRLATEDYETARRRFLLRADEDWVPARR